MNSVDVAVITVFKRELLTIKIMGNHVSPIVVDYLNKRIEDIESGAQLASY
jgi:hypothetical protein|tara:strand:+ start:1086 stop:1238 length:153 start_codon:yes stop_codon:yes gene_type:complete